MIKIRFEFIRKHQKKCMMTNFKNTEDSDFLNDMETAFRCLGSNDIGIEGMLHKLFSRKFNCFRWLCHYYSYTKHMGTPLPCC